MVAYRKRKRTLYDYFKPKRLSKPKASHKKRYKSEYAEQITVIRKALKKLCPTLSVRRGRGTGYSWIDIRGSGKWGEFTEKEKEALKKFGLNFGVNFANISPEDREFYAEKAWKLLGY